MEGCAKCSLESDVCEQCLDKEAQIVDGKCVCENGFDEDGTCKEKTSTPSSCLDDEVMVDGECKKCSELIDGCGTCSSANTCTKCIDD